MAEQRHTNARTQIHIQRRRRRKNTRIWCCAAVCCFFTSHRKSPLSTYANFSSPLCFLRAFFASCFTPPSTNLLLFKQWPGKNTQSNQSNPLHFPPISDVDVDGAHNFHNPPKSHTTTDRPRRNDSRTTGETFFSCSSPPPPPPAIESNRDRFDSFFLLRCCFLLAANFTNFCSSTPNSYNQVTQITHGTRNAKDDE